LSCVMFPVSFFYHFLYYTDSGSTFFVLLSYFLALKKKYLASAAVTGVNQGISVCNDVPTD
jgi:alpha-1,2-glucosyltransferase